MTNKAKCLNYWNLAIGTGSEDLESGLMLKGCIFESEEKLNFLIKDPENNDKAISSISNNNSTERIFGLSTASYGILKNELSKKFKELFNQESIYYDLSANAVALSYSGEMFGELESEDIPSKVLKDAEVSFETDSAQFDEVYEDSFDGEHKIIVAWSWTYNFINEPKFENDVKNQKLLDIYSEVTSNGWNTILEDELKTENRYNNMVYFKI